MGTLYSLRMLKLFVEFTNIKRIWQKDKLLSQKECGGLTRPKTNYLEVKSLTTEQLVWTGGLFGIGDKHIHVIGLYNPSVRITT